MLVREGFPEKKLKFNIKLEVHKHPTEIIGAAASVPSLRFDPQLVAALCDQMVGVVDRVEGQRSGAAFVVYDQEARVLFEEVVICPVM